MSDDRIKALREEIEGWKRVAVVAAVALEPIRMSGSHRLYFAPVLADAVDDAMVVIRTAISGGGFPDRNRYAHQPEPERLEAAR